MVEKRLSKIAWFSLTLGLLMFWTFLVSNFYGLTATGFESVEVLSLQTFYYIGIAFGVIVFLFGVYSIFLKKGDDKYGNSIGFNSLGEFPHLRFFKRFTRIQLAWIFFILFMILGLANATFLNSQSYTGVGLLETQQFTQAESFAYSSIIIPGAENLGLYALIGFMMVMIGLAARKWKWSKFTLLVVFWTAIIILPGLYGLGNHQIRYSGSEISQIKVFGFWSVSGVITGLTGIPEPAFILHELNNIFVELNRFMSSDTFIISIIVVIIALIALYGFVYRGRLWGKKIT